MTTSVAKKEQEVKTFNVIKERLKTGAFALLILAAAWAYILLICACGTW